MAQYGVGNTRVRVEVQSHLTGKRWVAVVKDSITISRSPNSPSSLTCSIKRDEFSPEEGDLVAVIIDYNENNPLSGHRQFYGYIITVEKDETGWGNITAYDQLWFLQNNTAHRYIYVDNTADEVYKMIINDTRLRTVDEKHIMSTDYKIPYRIEENSNYIDIMQKALDITFEQIGRKFYMWDDFGSLCLHSEQWLALQPQIIISCSYVSGYSYKEDGSNRKTAIEVKAEVKADENSTTNTSSSDNQSQEDKNKAELENALGRKYETYVAENTDAIRQFGYRRLNADLAEGENGQHKAEQLLKENQESKKTLNLNGVQGDITVRGGTPLLVDFFSHDKKEFVRGWFSTESVTHNINHGYHTMDLNLSLIKMFDDWDIKAENIPYGFMRDEEVEIWRKIEAGQKKTEENKTENDGINYNPALKE